jgi:peroxiredoxin
MMKAACSTGGSVARQVAKRQIMEEMSVRTISVGTDLSTSSVTWQAARPWHMEDGASNLAVDHARPMSEVFGPGRTVAVFGVPAPFTGVCTNAHYPPYKALASEFKTKAGVDEVICYTVADPYSLYNWGQYALENDPDAISFCADVDCEWAKEQDLDRDYTGASLGIRSERFSMIVKDGIVTSFNVVDDATKDAELLLSQAKQAAAAAN